MSRFDGLAAVLAEHPGPALELTFADMDRLVTGGLPASARRHQAWWANSRTAQPHARFWLDSGWAVHADLARRRVRFTKGGSQAEELTVRSAELGVAATAMSVTVTYAWRDVGLLGVDGRRLSWPVLPSAPGVLMVEVKGMDGSRSVYAGAGNDLAALAARLDNLASGSVASVRSVAAIRAALAAGGAATVRLVLAATVDGTSVRLADVAIRDLVRAAVMVREGSIALE